MTHASKAHVSSFAIAALVGLALCGTASVAQAKPTYPPIFQESLSKTLGIPICVPQCTACHQTSLGGLKTLNVFGKNLQDKAGLTASQISIDSAVMTYFALTPDVDSDGDGVSDRQELVDGSSPSIPGERGQGLFCPDIKYGCGASVAPARPPVDRLGLFGAALAVLGLAIGRRLQRRQR